MVQTGFVYIDDPIRPRTVQPLLELVEPHYGNDLDLPENEGQKRLADELGDVTPKVGAAAAIFNADGRQPLVKRPESGTWCFPGSYVEITDLVDRRRTSVVSRPQRGRSRCAKSMESEPNEVIHQP